MTSHHANITTTVLTAKTNRNNRAVPGSPVGASTGRTGAWSVASGGGQISRRVAVRTDSLTISPTTIVSGSEWETDWHASREAVPFRKENRCPTKGEDFEYAKKSRVQK